MKICLMVLAVLIAAAPSLFLGWKAITTEEEPSHGADASLITDSEDPGPPVVGAAPAQGESPEFYLVKAKSFEKAPAAAEQAVKLMPFPVRLPTHMPQDLRLYYVDGYLDSAGIGHLELYYTTDEPAGTDKPGIRLNWSNGAELSDIEPKLHPVESQGTFAAAGEEFRYFLQAWPAFKTYQARRITDDGVLIMAEIRLIGFTSETALSELQKVLDSLGPIAAP